MSNEINGVTYLFAYSFPHFSYPRSVGHGLKRSIVENGQAATRESLYLVDGCFQYSNETFVLGALDYRAWPPANV